MATKFLIEESFAESVACQPRAARATHIVEVGSITGPQVPHVDADRRQILEGKMGHSYEVDIWSLGVIM